MAKFMAIISKIIRGWKRILWLNFRVIIFLLISNSVVSVQLNIVGFSHFSYQLSVPLAVGTAFRRNPMPKVMAIMSKIIRG